MENFEHNVLITSLGKRTGKKAKLFLALKTSVAPQGRTDEVYCCMWHLWVSKTVSLLSSWFLNFY